MARKASTGSSVQQSPPKSQPPQDQQLLMRRVHSQGPLGRNLSAIGEATLKPTTSVQAKSAYALEAKSLSAGSGSVLTPTIAKAIRWVFVAVVWHESLTADLLTSALYLNFHQSFDDFETTAEMPASFRHLREIFNFVRETVRAQVDSHRRKCQYAQVMIENAQFLLSINPRTCDAQLATVLHSSSSYNCFPANAGSCSSAGAVHAANISASDAGGDGVEAEAKKPTCRSVDVAETSTEKSQAIVSPSAQLQTVAASKSITEIPELEFCMERAQEIGSLKRMIEERERAAELLSGTLDSFSMLLQLFKSNDHLSAHILTGLRRCLTVDGQIRHPAALCQFAGANLQKVVTKFHHILRQIFAQLQLGSHSFQYRLLILQCLQFQLEPIDLDLLVDVRAVGQLLKLAASMLK